MEARHTCSRGIFSNANIFNDIPLHEPPLQAVAISNLSVLRIRIMPNVAYPAAGIYRILSIVSAAMAQKRVFFVLFCFVFLVFFVQLV